MNPQKGAIYMSELAFRVFLRPFRPISFEAGLDFFFSGHVAAGASLLHQFSPMHASSRSIKGVHESVGPSNGSVSIAHRLRAAGMFALEAKCLVHTFLEFFHVGFFSHA